MKKESINRVVPPGLKLISKIKPGKARRGAYRAGVLIITFLAYACYHASRKPSSIVKNALDGDSSPLTQLSSSNGWAPFNGKGGAGILGEMDVAFLGVYSLGMYLAGHVGDRLDLRIFLTFGMIGSGMCGALFGLGYWWNVHNFWFYLVMQMIGGLFQATGWPCVVAVVGNWVGKEKRGLIMGIWNAHTSIGNICGSLIAASVLEYGWGWSFLLPGALVALGGLMVFLFLVVDPQDVGFSSTSEDYDCDDTNKQGSGGDEEEGLSKLISEKDEEIPLLQGSGASSNGKAIGFIEAWKIPGVAPFALCLFFSKLVAYTFLYWLPFYISQTAIAGDYLSTESAGNLSTLFDVGGVLGGILAGHISDKLNARATTAAGFMYCSIPVLVVYRIYGNISMTVNIALMMVAGMFVNGPYSLITTAVAADLGTHTSLKGNSRALATVTAIIDGTGSVGAALGPLLTGFISAQGWNSVFTMLMIAALIAGLLLTRLVIAEIAGKFHKGRS